MSKKMVATLFANTAQQWTLTPVYPIEHDLFYNVENSSTWYPLTSAKTVSDTAVIVAEQVYDSDDILVYKPIGGAFVPTQSTGNKLIVWGSFDCPLSLPDIDQESFKIYTRIAITTGFPMVRFFIPAKAST